MDSVLAQEQAIRRREMVLLIRVKNALSKQQQDRLQELRTAEWVERSDEVRKFTEGLQRLDELKKPRPEP